MGVHCDEKKDGGTLYIVMRRRMGVHCEEKKDGGALRKEEGWPCRHILSLG